MKEYLNMVKRKIREGLLTKFVLVLREENEQADGLAKAASVEHIDFISQVLSFVQYSLAIDKVEVQMIPLEID